MSVEHRTSWSFEKDSISVLVCHVVGKCSYGSEKFSSKQVNGAGGIEEQNFSVVITNLYNKLPLTKNGKKRGTDVGSNNIKCE